MIKVYIAGPITKGDQFQNVRNAIDAADELMSLGLVPFLPHTNCFWHMVHPRPAKEWYQYDIHWLAMCDCVLRLPGESWGSDIEEQIATRYDKPVYYTIEDLVDAQVKR
jgi:hypothetical protein